MVYEKLIGVSRLWSGVENEREGASLLPSLSCPQMEFDSSLCPIYPTWEPVHRLYQKVLMH